MGANIAGLPGFALGRTDYITIAMTNNYGDMQDLYVETVDPNSPDRYLEGKKSLPFEIIAETLKIKDKEAPEGYREENIKIRLTRRGPVVSDVLPDLQTKKVITLRWAPVESMTPVIGLPGLLTAKSTADLHEALARVPMLCLNWVFADVKGNIGYRASGTLPIRPGATVPSPTRSPAARTTGKAGYPRPTCPTATTPNGGGWESAIIRQCPIITRFTTHPISRLHTDTAG